MTEAEILAFPEVRSGGPEASPNAQASAQTRAHTREESKPERRRLRLPMPSARAVSGVLAGSSLMAAAAPAVLTVWTDHRQAAAYWRRWYARYPRLAWGAGHAFIEVPVLYLWAWSGHSPVLRVFVVATVLAILRLGFGVHVIWSWL